MWTETAAKLHLLLSSSASHTHEHTDSISNTHTRTKHTRTHTHIILLHPPLSVSFMPCMICFPMFSTDEGEVLGRSGCVCKCVLSLCGHIFAFSQGCEDLLEGSLQLQKAVWGLRLGFKGSVRIIAKVRVLTSQTCVMSGMQLREESVCVSVVFYTSLCVHRFCVCMCFIHSVLMNASWDQSQQAICPGLFCFPITASP